MRLAYKMEYIRPIDEKASVEMVAYSSAFQENYRKIYNDCYHEMREALKIEPYDYIQDDSFFETGMNAVYLLLNGTEIIGSVALKKDEIDDLIVNPRYQGQGYGRKILIWALNHINTKTAALYVAGWNEKAIMLYKKTGFEITETIVI